jgi:hypothetical protein
MMASDVDIARRDALIERSGYRVAHHNE